LVERTLLVLFHRQARLDEWAHAGGPLGVADDNLSVTGIVTEGSHAVRGDGTPNLVCAAIRTGNALELEVPSDEDPLRTGTFSGRPFR
jgi:hypothetical protein